MPFQCCPQQFERSDQAQFSVLGHSEPLSRLHERAESGVSAKMRCHEFFKAVKNNSYQVVHSVGCANHVRDDVLANILHKTFTAFITQKTNDVAIFIFGSQQLDQILKSCGATNKSGSFSVLFLYRCNSSIYFHISFKNSCSNLGKYQSKESLQRRLAWIDTGAPALDSPQSLVELVGLE
jgi:hypothetical protein